MSSQLYMYSLHVLLPELDVVEERGLVEIHEAAVVVNLLFVIVLGRVQRVVGAADRSQGSVPGLDHGTILAYLNNVAKDEPLLGVAYPHLVTIHV